MSERLQKAIARSGLCSRRAAEELIRAGRVTVDGAAAYLGQKIDEGVAAVAVDGIRLPVAPGLVYYLLNKPVGVVSTAADTHGRPAVVDLVPAEPRVFPVGRLDQDSHGLILLTNDGDLAQRVTHPRYGVAKTYSVLVDGRLEAPDVRRLRDGVELEDGPARALRARVIDRLGERTMLEISMAEGRKREIRRMCDALGTPVVDLFRTAIGTVRDAKLKSGEWRALDIGEVRALYEETGP